MSCDKKDRKFWQKSVEMSCSMMKDHTEIFSQEGTL